MSRVVRIGDSLSHGGSVVQGSPTVFAGGIPVARQGDRCVCAKHGSVSIVGGCSGGVFANGRPVAKDGAKCSCGASISASCSNVDVT